MKNGKQVNLEARLEHLEEEVRQLKALVASAHAQKEPWWKAIVGTFENNPAFEEVTRLGREAREKERKKAQRRHKAKS